MNDEFMMIDTPLPSATLRLPVSSTAKVMYDCWLDEILTDGEELLFVRFSIVELAASLSRSPMAVKRSLNELEQAGIIMRVRQGVGEANHIYILLPKEDAAHE